MRCSTALKVSILEKVLPTESRSVMEVTREAGINYQTIKNWIKQYETGPFVDLSTESCPRFLTAKERYQLLVDATSIKEDVRGGFLCERGRHS